MIEKERSASDRLVFVCQGRTCRKYGAGRVLEAFRAESVPGVEIVGCGCLGQCGNGPMVIIEPEHIWYWRVRPNEVSLIIEQHLRSSHPLVKMLYPKFHS
jgi:(2Fe-2S) ferredoxin